MFDRYMPSFGFETEKAERNNLAILYIRMVAEFKERISEIGHVLHERALLRPLLLL